MTDERKPTRGDAVLVTIGRGASAQEAAGIVRKVNGTTMLVQIKEKTLWVRTHRTRLQPQPEPA